jgi:hypothetical protein
MKKMVRFSIAGMLVLGVLFVSVSSVFASSSAAVVSNDPVATANDGAAFSSTVIDTAYLPGVVNDDGVMIMPVGFTSGTGQFSGQGIAISGLEASGGTVNVCFSFPTYQYGWSGSIYQWSGSEWTAVTTSMVAPTGENSIYSACSSNVGNGTYALIVGYKAPAE